MRIVPYTTSTGLQIGCLYEAPKHIEYSPDAYMLQSALLMRSGSTSRAVSTLWLHFKAWLLCE